MRAIGFRSNILFAIAAAFGVIAALGRPWYGAKPGGRQEASVGELPLQMEDFMAGVGRAFSEKQGTTGWDSFMTADKLIAGLAVGTVLLLVLTMVPSLRVHVRVLARWSALGTLAVVLFKLFDEPGANQLTEPRWGLLVALCSAGVLVASAATVATTPIPRRAPVKTYIPTPPAPREPESTWGPQQY